MVYFCILFHSTLRVPATITFHLYLEAFETWYMILLFKSTLYYNRFIQCDLPQIITFCSDYVYNSTLRDIVLCYFYSMVFSL